jgi:CubicO group peptidase (beta-lactamase class C family)
MIRLQKIITLLMAASFLCCLPVKAAQAPDSIISKVDAILEQQKTDQPGLSILIRHQDQIILKRSKGLSRTAFSSRATLSKVNGAEKGQTINADTSFRIASISKPFTAIAIMQLVEKGDINLSDSIRQYLPELNEKWQPFSVSHLLSHRVSVSKDFFDHNSTQRSKNATNVQALKFVNSNNIKVKALPKNKGLYCNICFVLLAETISRVSGESFATYMQRYIFEPANMHNSYIYDKPDKLRQNTAFNYAKNAKIYDIFQYNSGTMGQVSSTTDLNQFIVALKSGKLIKQSSLDMMTQVHADLGDDGFYGLGWTIGWDAQPFFSHGGSNDGYESELFFHPKHELEVVILSNGGEAAYEIKLQIMRAIIKHFSAAA